MPDLLDNAAVIAKSGYVPVQIDPASFERLAAIRRASQPVKGPVAAALIVSAALLANQSWVLASVALALAGLVLLRSEEHTSELQSLMRISYAVFCLKKKKNHKLQ